MIQAFGTGGAVDLSGLASLLPTATAFVLRKRLTGRSARKVSRRTIRRGCRWMSLHSGERLEFAEFYKEFSCAMPAERVIVSGPLTFILEAPKFSATSTAEGERRRLLDRSRESAARTRMENLEDDDVPERQIPIPGVVSHATNVVEHSEVVADRLARFAELVRRANVIASTDCGLGFRVHPQIAWAKLKVLSEGAALASQRLY